MRGCRVLFGALVVVIGVPAVAAKAVPEGRVADGTSGDNFVWNVTAPAFVHVSAGPSGASVYGPGSMQAVESAERGGGAPEDYSPDRATVTEVPPPLARVRVVSGDVRVLLSRADFARDREAESQVAGLLDPSTCVAYWTPAELSTTAATSVRAELRAEGADLAVLRTDLRPQAMGRGELHAGPLDARSFSDGLILQACAGERVTNYAIVVRRLDAQAEGASPTPSLGGVATVVTLALLGGRGVVRSRRSCIDP